MKTLQLMITIILSNIVELSHTHDACMVVIYIANEDGRKPAMNLQVS